MQRKTSLDEEYRRVRSSLTDDVVDWSQKYPELAAEVGVYDGLVGDPGIHALLHVLARQFAYANVLRQQSLGRLYRDILRLKAPDYSRIIPSCQVLQFTPARGALLGKHVPRGSEVKPAAGSGEQLGGPANEVRYQTTQGLRLWGVSVTGASLSHSADKGFFVQLTFKSEKKTFDQLDGLDQLRLYLNGPYELTFPLREALLTAKRAYVDHAPHQPLQIEACGFTDEEALLPLEKGTSRGNRLLQELVFPEKFMFVDLNGLSLPRLGRGNELKVIIELDGNWRALEPVVKAGNFLLDCAPAINVCNSSVCVTVTPQRFAEQVTPEVGKLTTAEVLEVQQVYVTQGGPIGPVPALYDEPPFPNAASSPMRYCSTPSALSRPRVRM